MCVGVVGCCRCCPGGVLTAEGGPCHSWRRFPCASLAGGLALAPSVSLLPMASYRVVSPWWLSWMLRVAVGEVPLPVVPSVMPVVRSLRALLWFTASLMLLMLLVVGVGLCVGCQCGCCCCWWWFWLRVGGWRGWNALGVTWPLGGFLCWSVVGEDVSGVVLGVGVAGVADGVPVGSGCFRW